MGKTSSRRRAPGLLVALLVLGACGLAACGGSSGSAGQGSSQSVDVSPAGDIPDTQAFVEYRSPDGTFVLQVPEGWARTDLASGVTFSDKLNTIRVETRARPDAPTEATAQADDVPALRAAAPRFHLTKVTTVRRSAGGAVLIEYQARGPADPVTGQRRLQDVEVYEFWKSGTLATITLSSPHGADNVDPWRTVTQSFAWAR